MRILSGLVLCICLAAASGALAADKEVAQIRETILKAMENWSALNAEANEGLYTKSERAIFFDFTPMQYVGWQTYKAEIDRVTESIREFKITLNDDLTVHRRGHVAWATSTWKMHFHFKDGKIRNIEGRLTEVLEKIRGKWVIVHEHASVPLLDWP